MAIKAKASSSTILAKSFTEYSEKTFEQEKMSMFLEVTAEQLLEMVKPLKVAYLDERIIAVDTETYFTGILNNRMPSSVVRRWVHQGAKFIPNDFPFCISVSDATHSFVVYDTLKNGFKEFKKLAPLLEDRSIIKCGQNIDYDLHMLANCGVNVKGRLIDTMILSKLTRADAFTHNLLDIATEISSDYPTVTKFERMLRSYKDQHRITDYRLFPKELMNQYTCADTWNTIFACDYLYQKMLENGQEKLFEVESETMFVSYKMERTGIHIDKLYENVLLPELRKEVEDAERAIYDEAGTTFNINSSQQLFDILSKMGYGSLVNMSKPTELMLAKGVTKGNPKFDKFEMERLEAEGVPLIVDIQKYKKAEKLLNTFAIKLYEMADAEDTVHCNINTIEAKTGRFSISSPSMQNMPRRSDSRIRDAFIARPGYTLYDFDFKAQESLIMTHYSSAPYLLDIVNAGGDIHKAVAAIIYDVPMSAVDKKLREIAKSVEFAIVYGAGADKVSQMTGLTIDESKQAIQTFKRRVPEVENFIRIANKVIKDRGCIKTILGRLVYGERGREYACVNYLCQGSAADSTKTRMNTIYRFLKANGYKTRMILQVHDSLLQEVADNETDVLGYLRWLQTERDLFRVQVTVDVCKCGATWRTKADVDVAAIKPPDEMMYKALIYDIWNEGIL